MEKFTVAQWRSALFAMGITLICLAVPIGFGVVELSTEQVALPEDTPAFTYRIEEGKISLSLIHTTLFLDLSPLYHLHQWRLAHYNVVTPWWLKNTEAFYFMANGLWECYDDYQKEYDYQMNIKLQ